MRIRFSYMAFLLWMITIVGLVWCWNSQKETIHPHTEFEKTVQELEQQNDSLLVINRGLKNRIDKQLEKQEGIKEELEKQNKRIEQLKNRKSEKIRVIHDFNNDELYRFFAEHVPGNREFETVGLQYPK